MRVIIKPTLSSVWLVFGVTALLLAGCSILHNTPGSEHNLPSITENSTGETHPGKVIWHDLLTSDLACAKNFYGKLFDWSFETFSPRYVEIRHNGHKIGGLLQLAENNERKPAAQWLISLSTTNMTDTLRQIKKNGGQCINGPQSWGARGTIALLVDPQKAHFLALCTLGNDPEDTFPQTGDWLWNEVWTLHPEQEVDFYRKLFPYPNMHGNNDYIVLLNEDRWRIGIRKIKNKAYAGRWVPAIRVNDPFSMVKKVEMLGGKVLTPPDLKQRHGNAALVADPNGALFILQYWDFTKSSRR